MSEISFQVTNPATGEQGEVHPFITDDALGSAVESAVEAAAVWRSTPLAERCATVRAVADGFAARAQELASIITREMGKPVSQALGEVGISDDIFRFYADNAEKLLADEPLQIKEQGSAHVRKAPIGVVLGIMPWNYPYYQVARFAAPNLVAGNVVLLKHAPQCPESALAIAEVLADAGVPQGVYTNLFATTAQLSTLIADPRVAAVSLTGSSRAGAAVAEQAGRHLKKVVLELGGSDPFIVLPSADIDHAVADAVTGRFGNTGQACNAAKRFIVLDEVYDEFASKVRDAIAALQPADPTEPNTFIGPLSSVRARDLIAAQVDQAVAEGANVLVGGHVIDRPGAWYEPTLLTDVRPRTRAYAEELFGPVAVLYRVADLDQAVALANDTAYGLGAVVHGRAPQLASQLADRLDVGMVSFNTAPISAADQPFGGTKTSGFGRELGPEGIEQFLNRKVIYDAGTNA